MKNHEMSWYVMHIICQNYGVEEGREENVCLNKAWDTVLGFNKRSLQNTNGYPHSLQLRLEKVIVTGGLLLKKKKLKIYSITS